MREMLIVNMYINTHNHQGTIYIVWKEIMKIRAMIYSNMEYFISECCILLPYVACGLLIKISNVIVICSTPCLFDLQQIRENISATLLASHRLGSLLTIPTAFLLIAHCP